VTNPYTMPNAAENNTSNEAVTTATLDALRGTKGWVKLVGILLLIGAAFTVLGALAVLVIPSMSGAGKAAMPMAVVGFMAVLYVGISIIYVLLGLYLLKYAGAINRLLIDRQVATMEAALQFQQKFWRLAGIITLIMLVISVLGIIAAVAIPMFARR
jgi:hypothetical protein